MEFLAIFYLVCVAICAIVVCKDYLENDLLNDITTSYQITDEKYSLVKLTAQEQLMIEQELSSDTLNKIKEYQKKSKKVKILFWVAFISFLVLIYLSFH